MYDIMDEFTLASVGEFIDNAFFEFCHTIDSIQEYQESAELYLEAVSSPKTSVKGRLSQDLSATARTTGNVLAAANSIIDAKASVISAGLNLVFKVCGYAGKLLGYLATKVMDIINGTTKIIDNIGNIPANIRATIKGDIKLYITIGDIQQVYDQLVISRLDTAISELDLFTKGDTWGHLLNKNKVQANGFVIKSDDKHLANKIRKDATALKVVNFTQSVVRMDVEENREAYFSNKKVVTIKGKTYSYVEAIGKLLTDLSSRKDTINSLRQAFDDKRIRTELNGNWANLTKDTQNVITATMQHISTILAAIGNFVKYATLDLKTIGDSVTKITKKYSDKDSDKNATAKKKKK